MTEPKQQNRAPQRSYWRWSKEDFFPEQSFQSLQSYKTALLQTCPRLKDRLFVRSSDATELFELSKESENPMRKCLTWWDLMWLGFGSVVGSGIFALTGLEAHDHAGPAIVLSYAVSGLSALISAFCYTEFAVEVPVAGGSFSFLRIELGDFVAFITGGNLLLEAIVGASGLARSWSGYFGSTISKSNDPNFLRFHVSNLPDGFDYIDPVASLVLLVCNCIAMSGTKRTSVLNSVTSVLSALVIVFIVIVGFIYTNSSNWVPFMPYGTKGVFQAAAVVYWSYTGFDMVATMAEETKKPSRDIPVGLVGSMSMITVVYCLMALALTGMQNYTMIDREAAYSIAFTQIGMKWAKYLVSICALKGMTTSLLAGALGQSRYLTQFARSHMIPPYFALVHPKSGTPVNATLLMTVFSVIVALFTSLDVLSSVFSISTLFIFMLMAVALLVRRYYVKDVTPQKDLHRFLGCVLVICGSSIAVAVLWKSNYNGWVGYAVAGVIWFLGTLAMAFLPKYRVPKTWGAPLVPWLPSFSVGLNIFLVGSLEPEAFYRFIICTAVMLLYYLFVGVHATFDVAHNNQPELKAEQGEGNTS